MYIAPNGNNTKINGQLYPDGFPVVNCHAEEILAHDRGYSMLVVRPLNMAMLMKALMFADAARWRGRAISTLIIPYLPGARQDRLNPAGDFLFAAKSIAQEINARKFDNVICFDPHSEVMPALIDNCVTVHVTEISGLWPENCYDGVVAPDAGAGKRASAIASLLHTPVFNAWKTRDVASGNSKITGFGIEEISGVQRLLIVDDICDGGGTFVGLAEHIKSIGQSYEIEIDLYVSHGLFTKGITHLETLFESIITTDSVEPRGIDVRPHKLVVRPVLEQLIDKGFKLA